jgi:hypothetical protein
VIGISFVEVFDTKVVNGEDERSAMSVVAPENSAEVDRSITKRSKVVAELFISEGASLFEAVHAFANFKVAKTLGIEICISEVMFVSDLLGEIAAMDLHVLEDLHVRAKKEVFEIASTVASARLVVKDGTVDMMFGVNNTNSRRANILKGFEAVTTNSHANLVWFGFAGRHGADKSGIGDLAASGTWSGRTKNLVQLPRIRELGERFVERPVVQRAHSLVRELIQMGRSGP